MYHENNPYHNALHAADVTQAIYCLLKKLRVERLISSFDFMCALLASMCHDIDHPGVNQSFLIKTKQLLYILYQVCTFTSTSRTVFSVLQESILENHHSNVCISVLLQSKVFSAFSVRRWCEYLEKIFFCLSNQLYCTFMLQERNEVFHKAPDFGHGYI